MLLQLQCKKYTREQKKNNTLNVTKTITIFKLLTVAYSTDKRKNQPVPTHTKYFTLQQQVRNNNKQIRTRLIGKRRMSNTLLYILCYSMKIKEGSQGILSCHMVIMLLNFTTRRVGLSVSQAFGICSINIAVREVLFARQ